MNEITSYQIQNNNRKLICQYHFAGVDKMVSYNPSQVSYIGKVLCKLNCKVFTHCLRVVYTSS